MENFDFKTLADKWPSELVARREVERFTGGALRARTLANLDSLGQGPSVRLKIGRSVCYPVDVLVAWLEMRATDPRG